LYGGVIAALVLSGLAYLPGLSGPYVLDDITNLLTNDYIRLQALSPDDLYRSAYSSKAGPLERPIAMLSFALNYYFAGGFDNSLPFKLTNLVIHVINSLLVFWLAHLLFTQLARIAPSHNGWIKPDRQALILLPGSVALLWALNPIQLTTVLYVVQRMVGLAALFTLLGLICYLIGRARILEGRRGGILIAGSGLLGFGLLGVFSKENAVLLVPWVLMLELVLFRNELPVSRWRTLTPLAKYLIILLGVVALVGTLGWIIHHASPDYALRRFNMGERLLTEARVLWFYILLILVPRLDAMGLSHDDIVISTSLLTPWTTLPSLLGILGLLAFAIASWVRRPLTTIGILWFLIGHSLESTFFAFEIAYEHRNYLPSIGVILVLIDLLGIYAQRFQNKRVWLAVPVLAILFCGATYSRSLGWSDFDSLARFEAGHHPDSPRAQLYLGTSMANKGNYDAAMKAMRRAAQLDQYDAVYHLNMHLISAYYGLALSVETKAETLQRLVGNRISASTLVALQVIHGCLPGRCRSLQRDVETWARAILADGPPNADRSFFYFMLGRSLYEQGRIQEAVAALQKSCDADQNYLHPLFEMGQILIQSGKLKEAEAVLENLREANKQSAYTKDSDLKIMAERLAAAQAMKRGVVSNNQR
jgi:tetratricopeptide (TPR) repeat protein